MKIERITLFAACATDDKGYAKNHLAYFPISAAAAAYLANEHPNLGYYSAVSKLTGLRIGDDIFLMEKELNKNSAKCVIPLLKPTFAYEDYVYENGWDKSTYYTTWDDISAVLQEPGKRMSIRQVILFRTDEEIFLLSKMEPVKMESFTMSRELGVAHALSKLTPEEKKLLGLE
jgi:hypothetical protein